MAKDALNSFANMLYEEAKQHSDAVTADLDAKRKERLAETDAQLASMAKTELRRGTAALKHQKKLSIARREMELHKALLENRRRTFCEVFAAVEKNVRAFTQTPDYEAYLSSQLTTALSLLNPAADSRLICRVMPKDLDRMKKLKTAFHLEYTTTKEDLIGGFTLEDTQQKRFVDGTLAARIQEQKERFDETSGLIID